MTKERSWLSFARRSVQFWVGVGLIGFGAIFSVVQVAILAQEQQYGREGQLIDGVVVSKAIRRATRSGSSGTSTQYTVAYRFTIGGQTYNGDESVSSGEWDQLVELEPVQIQYVASNPARNRIAGRTSAVLSYAVRRRRGRRGDHRSGAPGEIDPCGKDESAYLDARNSH